MQHDILDRFGVGLLVRRHQHFFGLPTARRGRRGAAQRRLGPLRRSAVPAGRGAAPAAGCLRRPPALVVIGGQASLSDVGSMKTLRLQRDPDGLFLWHPDYAPWIVGRRSREANPNDRAFFDPNTGEIVWSSRDGMKDYEMDELAARHLAGELVEMPQCEASGRLRPSSSSAGSRSNGSERHS